MLPYINVNHAPVLIAKALRLIHSVAEGQTRADNKNKAVKNPGL